MISQNDLVTSLCAQLPPDLHPHVPALARIIEPPVTAALGSFAGETITSVVAVIVDAPLTMALRDPYAVQVLDGLAAICGRKIACHELDCADRVGHARTTFSLPCLPASRD